MADEDLVTQLYGPRGANQEVSDSYNRQPAVLNIVDGSPYAKEMAKFSSFPIGGFPAGNPYTYRPFPKMLYKAERFNGSPSCMAAPPPEWEFKNPGEFARAETAAARFSERCQKIVNDEREMQKAMEMGYRESPAEAVAWLINKDKAYSKEEAHRAWDDRNLSPAAQAEIQSAKDAVGGDPTPEIKEQPLARRGPGRPRKNPDPAA